MPRRGPARALACALLLALSAAASALYDAGSPVISDLTDANYKSKLKGLALVELFAPCACPALRTPVRGGRDADGRGFPDRDRQAQPTCAGRGTQRLRGSARAARCSTLRRVQRLHRCWAPAHCVAAAARLVSQLSRSAARD